MLGRHADVRDQPALPGDRRARRQLHAVPPGRGAAHRRHGRADDARPPAGAFRVGVQLSAPFLVFGLLFNLGLGVLSRLMPQMQVFFVGMPLSILARLLILLLLVIGAMMGTFSATSKACCASSRRTQRLRISAMADGTRRYRKNRRPQPETARRRAQARRRRQEPGGQYLVRDRGRGPRAAELLRHRWVASSRRRCAASSPMRYRVPADGAGADAAVPAGRHRDDRGGRHPVSAARRWRRSAAT